MPKEAVLIHTVRGGKDPADFWHVVTKELADELDENDPWRTLGDYEARKDARVLGGLFNTRDEAEAVAKGQGYSVHDEEMDAVGY